MTISKETIGSKEGIGKSLIYTTSPPNENGKNLMKNLTKKDGAKYVSE